MDSRQHHRFCDRPVPTVVVTYLCGAEDADLRRLDLERTSRLLKQIFGPPPPASAWPSRRRPLDLSG
ncbi:hypothetical protein ACFCWY_14030 [Streptomyces sp. NPDC056362]|uniref:hypothetical protein n=1 Tax=unclassified Streptomyces TaxID=2593676 RepID=UPI0035DDEF5C